MELLEKDAEEVAIVDLFRRRYEVVWANGEMECKRVGDADAEAT